MSNLATDPAPLFTRMKIAFFTGLVATALSGCATSDDNAKSASEPVLIASPCSVGIYDAEDGFLAITRRNEMLHYSFSDGRYGKVNGEGPVECRSGSIRLNGSAGLTRRSISITDTRFAAGGVTLAGQLLEPMDAGADTPLVVLAHGSEELGWIEAVAYPYQLVGRGVSVFVYDKRGTGRSEGIYSQNFPDLADDMVAASMEAKRLANGRYGRFGLLGFSQGGWIAPLAAERADAEFIGIGYGLVVDILEEDATQVELELREAGYGEDIVELGKTITDVTARIAVSGYRDGLEELATLQRTYGENDWFKGIRGGFSGVSLSMSPEELREDGIPMFDRLNIDWSMKPMETLRQVDIPQLWVLAREDREAPIETTIERLLTLRQEGKAIDIYVFPGTDHGMREFVQASDGSRTSTRVTEGYYELIADWAKGTLDQQYAKSTRR